MWQGQPAACGSLPGGAGEAGWQTIPPQPTPPPHPVQQSTPHRGQEPSHPSNPTPGAGTRHKELGMGCPPPGPDSSKDGTRSCHLQWCKDTLAERLRRRPAKPMGSPCVGSNPTGVVLVLSSSSTSRGNFGWAWVQHVQKFLHSICVGVLHEWAACHGKQGGGRSFELTGTSSWRLQRTAPCVSAGQEGGGAAAGNSTQFPDANWCGESALAGPGVILSPWVAAM